jgi:hypothetical protein
VRNPAIGFVVPRRNLPNSKSSSKGKIKVEIKTSNQATIRVIIFHAYQVVLLLLFSAPPRVRWLPAPLAVRRIFRQTTILQTAPFMSIK